MFCSKTVALVTLQLLYCLDSILKHQIPALYDHTNLSIFTDLLYFLYFSVIAFKIRLNFLLFCSTGLME